MFIWAHFRSGNDMYVDCFQLSSIKVICDHVLRIVDVKIMLIYLENMGHMDFEHFNKLSHLFIHSNQKVFIDQV